MFPALVAVWWLALFSLTLGAAAAAITPADPAWPLITTGPAASG